MFIPADAVSLLSNVRDKLNHLREVLPSNNDNYAPGVHEATVAVFRAIEDLPYKWCRISPIEVEFYLAELHGGLNAIVFVPAHVTQDLELMERTRDVPHQGIPIDERIRLKPNSKLPEGVEIRKVPGDLYWALYQYLEDRSDSEMFRPRNFVYLVSAYIEKLLQSVRDFPAKRTLYDSPLSEIGQSWVESTPLQDQDKEAASSTNQNEKSDNDLSGSSDSFHCEGAMWRIRFQGQDITVKDSDGMHYLAMLVSWPGKSIGADRMYGQLKDGGGVPIDALIGEPDRRKVSASAPPTRAIVESTGDKLMDKAAIADAERRLSELKELQLSDSFQDPSSMAECKSEISKIERQLKNATRPSGDSKRHRTNADRRADNIRKAIQAAIRSIREHHSALAQHLTESINYGSAPVYSSDKHWKVIHRPIA